MDTKQISSEFLSNFEDFINTSKLDELEIITGYTLIKELGDDANPKLQFLNQGVNSKALILFFLLKTMENVKNSFSDYTGDITSELIELFKRYSHLRMRWSSDSVNKTVHASIEYGNKRQVSVKSRGTYYTPDFMSDFICKESVQVISQKKITSFEELVQRVEKNPLEFQLDKLVEILTLRVIDLSMGVGNFLCNAIPYLIQHLQILKDFINERLFPIVSEKDVKSITKSLPFCSNVPNYEINQFLGDFILNKCLYGIEIDSKIHKMAQIIVSLKVQCVLGTVCDLPSNLICKNSIISLKNPSKNAKIIHMIKFLNGFTFSEQFPEIFNSNCCGFDIVLGNPPWEILKPNNREFFNNYVDNFIHLNRSKQDELQAQILENKTILNIFEKYSQHIMSQTSAISSLEYAHQSSHIHDKVFTGDPQLFKFFLEIAFNVVKNEGIISLIVQHNFLGSKSCANLRKLYVNNGKFDGIWEFYNRSNGKNYFQNVDPNQRFIIFQYKKQEKERSDIHYKKCNSSEDLNSIFDPHQRISPDFYYETSNDELQLFGFENQEHRSVFEKILATNNNFSNYKWIDGELHVKLSQDLHVTRDREKFSANPTSVSLYGGRSFGPHYFRPIKERFLLENVDLTKKIPKKSIICRNIMPNSAKRIIFSTPPDGMLVDNSCTRLFFEKDDERALLFLLAVSNSLLVEKFLRTILTGMNLNYYLIQRIPIPSHVILTNKKYAELIRNLTKITKDLPNIPLETKEWGDAYAEIEAIVGYLFNLTKIEMEVVLDSFDFNKLQKTTLCGYKPFQELTKKLILDHFESMSSRFT